MTGLHLAVPLTIACALFGVGTYAVLARRNAILVLMGVELMLNAATLMLVSFDVYLDDPLLSGQSAALFFITMAAAEIGLALAIVLRVFRVGGSISLDTLRTLADRDDVRADDVRADDVRADDEAATIPGAPEQVTT